MTDIQGALGCAQMERADAILDARRERAGATTSCWPASNGCARRVMPAGYVHGYQSYVCLFAPEEPTLANVEPAARPPQRV